MMGDPKDLVTFSNEAGLDRIKSLAAFLSSAEEKLFDTDILEGGQYKESQLLGRYEIAAKVFADLWTAALKRQTPVMDQQASDEIEALFSRLLTLSVSDLDTLKGLVDLASSGVSIDQLLRLADQEASERPREK